MKRFILAAVLFSGCGSSTFKPLFPGWELEYCADIHMARMVERENGELLRSTYWIGPVKDVNEAEQVVCATLTDGCEEER